jgi:hypothetical protein
MTGTQVDGVARGDWQSDHDVSILIGVGAGQEVGWVPSAKISMISMRPPQRGQGQGNTRGSSAGGFSSSASFTGAGTFKSSRAHGDEFRKSAAASGPTWRDPVPSKTPTCPIGSRPLCGTIHHQAYSLITGALEGSLKVRWSENALNICLGDPAQEPLKRDALLVKAQG